MSQQQQLQQQQAILNDSRLKINLIFNESADVKTPEYHKSLYLLSHQRFESQLMISRPNVIFRHVRRLFSNEIGWASPKCVIYFNTNPIIDCVINCPIWHYGKLYRFNIENYRVREKNSVIKTIEIISIIHGVECFWSNVRTRRRLASADLVCMTSSKITCKIKSLLDFSTASHSYNWRRVRWLEFYFSAAFVWFANTFCFSFSRRNFSSVESAFVICLLFVWFAVKCLRILCVSSV